MDQAQAHAERHVQQAVDNLVYWATQMVESNDRGEVVTGEVRDNLMSALQETQALSLIQTPEAVSWWIGRYLERKTVQLDLAIGHERTAPTQEQEQRNNGPEARQDVSSSEKDLSIRS